MVGTIVGQVITGQYAQILVRQKHGETVELGELLVVDRDNGYIILECYDLRYGSQIPPSSLELMSGIKLEQASPTLTIMDPEIRNYVMVYVKSLANVNIVKKNGKTVKEVKLPKDLPSFFSDMRRIEPADLDFLQAPANTLYLGHVRSGSRVLPVEVKLHAQEVFRHHMLIPATTGRGKSNLVKVFSFKNLDNTSVGI
ncbi:MAG: DUF87 domain-containing protein, partial [Candidatus Sigynarchaeota archaeon]